MKKKIKEFKKHVNNYDLKEVAIKRKLEHSLRVMKISKILAKNLGLSKKDIELATLIGLLHDYARFEQWKRYKTYRDLDSVDHGDFGVNILFEENEIEKFTLNKDDYSLIKNAIKYHNKYDVSSDLDEYNKLHCEIIRDSDKLDIIYIYSKGIIQLKSVDKKINKQAKVDFYKNKLLNNKNVVNDSDKIIWMLSLIFDLNFKASIEYVKKKNYIWKFYNKIENREKYLEYFNYVDNYIKERLK